MKRIVIGFGKVVKWSVLFGIAALIGYSYNNVTQGNEIVIEEENTTDEIIEQLILREQNRLENDPKNKEAVHMMYRSLAQEAVEAMIQSKQDETNKAREIEAIKAKTVGIENK